MPISPKQFCPLCLDPATYEFAQDPPGKIFACKRCTTFFIDVSSERHIAGLPEVTKSERRKKLSEMARDCPPDHVFVIREPRSDERGGDGHGVARSEMIAQCLKR